MSSSPPRAGSLGMPAPQVPGYVIGEVLGQGASSTVWGARSQATGEPVAVKVSRSSHGFGRQVVAAVVRERAVLGAIVSEHVVRLRETRRLDDGAIALVLDLAEGGSLHDLVSIRGALPPGEVATIITPMAATLGALHAAGVVHGDLSPGNILFTAAGKPMLSDYGAARLIGEQHPHGVAGTTGFVAPEVEQGQLPTEASDVWSLAALAWYALGGATPPPTLDPSPGAWQVVGAQLGGVLVRMFAPDPRERPAASACAMAIYQAATPVPVRLAGRNVDAATAMTHRIRREAAAETRTRAELRAAARTTRGREGWRLVRMVRAVAAARSRWVSHGPVLLAAFAAFAALAVVAGVLMSLPGVRGGTSPGMPSEVPLGAVADTSPTGGPPLPAATRPPVPAATGPPVRAVPPTGRGASDLVAQLMADPRSVLQSVAQARATALMTADPVALVGAETPGSAAHEADVRVLAQLRSRQQRYADLVFHVRSAEVVRADALNAEVLAVIDRGRVALLGPGDAREELPARAGSALRYSLVSTDKGWRISAVGRA